MFLVFPDTINLLQVPRCRQIRPTLVLRVNAVLVVLGGNKGGWEITCRGENNTKSRRKEMGRMENDWNPGTTEDEASN